MQDHPFLRTTSNDSFPSFPLPSVPPFASRFSPFPVPSVPLPFFFIASSLSLGQCMFLVFLYSALHLSFLSFPFFSSHIRLFPLPYRQPSLSSSALSLCPPLAISHFFPIRSLVLSYYAFLSRNDGAWHIVSRRSHKTRVEAGGGESGDKARGGAGERLSGGEERAAEGISFVRRAFDDKEYISCGFIIVTFSPTI